MQRRTRLNILLVLSITVMLVFVSIACNTTSKPTVAEAEKQGFRRAYRFSGTGTGSKAAST